MATAFVRTKPKGGKRRSASKSGSLAMGHARTWADAAFPGAPRLEAYRKAMRITDLDAPDGYRILSRQEDLFGVFDLIVFRQPLVLVQVTSLPETGWADGNVSKRRKKIDVWLAQHHEHVQALGAWVFVLAWVKKSHFRVYTRLPGEWRETAPVHPKKAGVWFDARGPA